MLSSSIAWRVLVVTFSITFALLFSLHSGIELECYDAKQIPTISLTGSYMPELVILTSGLHIFAFLSLYFFTILWRVYHSKILRLQVEYSDETSEHVETQSERYVATVNTMCVHLSANKLQHLLLWSRRALLTDFGGSGRCSVWPCSSQEAYQ